MSELSGIYNQLEKTNTTLNRIANALEGIVRAFEPAKASLDAGPAQPEVGGVVVADD